MIEKRNLNSDVIILRDEVLNDENPSFRLQTEVNKHEKNPEFSVLLFENVFPFVIIKDYWTYYSVSMSYLRLGRDDASFFTANLALALQPSYENWHMYQNIYKYYRFYRRYDEALAIAEKQIMHAPTSPIIPRGEFERLWSACERRDKTPVLDLGGPPGEANYIKIASKGMFLPKISGLYGTLSKSHILDSLSKNYVRPELNVFEFIDGWLDIYDNNIIAYDRRGYLLVDACISEFPVALSKFIEMSQTDLVEVVHLDLAVVISDVFFTSNICHFLLDQIARLAIYGELIDVSLATVIGPPLDASYQKEIASLAGIKSYINSNERKRLQISKLIVSENCKKTFTHPSHLGSELMVSFIRSLKKNREQSKNRKKIYISRDDAAVRVIRNEDEVLKQIENAGFLKVSLSGMSFSDQVALFAEATHVMGMHGAGLTNIVFCEKQAFVLEVCHPLSGTAAYGIIASAIGIDYSLLIGNDADSPDPKYNDLSLCESGALGMGGRVAAANRDVIVDIPELIKWVQRVT